MTISEDLDARGVLHKFGVVPKKNFGQNFLTDRRTTEDIATIALKGAEGKHVVELGAGTGELTKALLDRGATVTAIERDRDLVPLLRERFSVEIAEGRCTIVEGDAKTTPWGPETKEGVVLVGNLPYQITGPLLERATGEATRFVHVVFMVQEEVADRLRAKPGTKEYGGLSVFTQAAFTVEKVRRVGASSFFPPPRVSSAVVRLTPKSARIAETEQFRALVHAAFGERRKTLRNAWSRVLGEAAVRVAGEAEISLDARGETLSPEAFARAATAFASGPQPSATGK